MQAVEFTATITDGKIEVPAEFLQEPVSNVRIIMLYEGQTLTDPFYDPANMAVLRQSIQEAHEGKFITKTLDELRAMEA